VPFGTLLVKACLKREAQYSKPKCMINIYFRMALHCLC